MKYSENILELVGQTPMVRLRTKIPENVLALLKLEFYSPSGSVKDRIAMHIIKRALDNGIIVKGDTVVDNTSGNTGTSIAMAASVFGLKSILVTPEKTSQEKVDMMKSFGAEVIVTPTEAGHDDPEGCYMVARKLAEEKGYFDFDQYDNQENIEAHYLTTGPEIWNDTDGKITHFVAGIGTGGTFSGTARYLKEQNPAVKTIAVDPVGSIFAEYLQNKRIIEGHTYKVEGIGTDVLTKAMDYDLVDDVITVSDDETFNRARMIARSEGISGGGSTGTVGVAIEKVAKTAKPGDLIVGICADAGIRYLSKCYNDQWMRENNFWKENEELVKK